jgi:hypothetical protein
MTRSAIPALIGGVIGIAAAAAGEAIGGATGLVVVGVLLIALATAQQVYCRVVVPVLLRNAARKRLDPSAGPPPGAEPAESEVVRRMGTARGWEAIEPMLSDDFAFIDGRGRRVGRGRYRRAIVAYNNIYPEWDSEVEAIVADPVAPDVFYLRTAMRSRPRLGPLLHTTTWTRYVLTPEHTKVREIEAAGVLSVA